MKNSEIEKVGELSEVVVRLLSLSFPAGTFVYLGRSNIEHMRCTHPRDFSFFSRYISELISAPSLIGLNLKDNSIEFIKRFPGLKDYRNFVKLAVRASNDGLLFARSLYEVEGKTIQNRLKAGTMKRLTFSD